MRAVVLADTHVRETGSVRLPERVWEAIDAADVILHAGDVVEQSLLTELRGRTTVHAVLGNNDHALRGVLPDALEVELGGVRVALIHDSGARQGREGRMRRRFPNADVVVFGHSHVPWNAPGLDGQWLFNPGSATQRRGQPHRTIGVLDLTGGRLRAHDIVAVD